MSKNLQVGFWESAVKQAIFFHILWKIFFVFDNLDEAGIMK
jgi:hypothetical protein